MNAPTVARRLWTRQEYDRMVEAGILGEDDRVELVAGEIVQKMPQNSPHATATTLGQQALSAVIGPGLHVRVQLPLALGDDSEPEPDLAVVSGSARDYRAAHPTTAALVVEVAESSLEFDRTWKESLYARSGIPEYWIINLVEGLLEVYRAPVADLTAPLGYRYAEHRRVGADEQVTLLAVVGATIAVGDLLP